MHQVIRAIVYAKDKEGAMDQAKEIFDGLVERSIFDYYVTFDEEGHGVSGKDRWGELPVCAKANSEEGKKLIEDGMKYTKDDFMENIKKIHACMSKYSDEELFEGGKELFAGGEGRRGDIMLFRYYCNHVGQYEGTSIWLYNNDSEGIQTEKELNDTLGKYASIYDDNGKKNPYADDTVWVVPADVHI